VHRLDNNGIAGVKGGAILLKPGCIHFNALSLHEMDKFMLASKSSTVCHQI
jgi:hypothetical protein